GARPEAGAGPTPPPRPGRREIERAIATLPREIKEAVSFVHLYHGSLTELALRLGDRGLEKAETRLKQAYRTLSARLRAPFPEAFESPSP
ncbi:MAG TPA: hypothetical protein VMU54_09880, partial [Planctomycetota bacterium]|nr:hypothetical protein [Planctomycetota bacterium]